MRLAVRNGHKHLVAKCCTGGGVQGDACALMIAVSSNNTDVLLLLLQAASAVVTWGAQEAMQLPLARLLTLVPPARHDDEETRAAEPQAEAGWACDELSSNECHLLDRIAHGCPYTLRQLQRAMAAAAAGGQAEVHLLPSARMMVKTSTYCLHRCSSCCSPPPLPCGSPPHTRPSPSCCHLLSSVGTGSRSLLL